MPYSVRIILDSIGPNGARLTTFEMSHPRIVHADFMTHRLLSRNGASSRAIPIEKVLQRIEDDPVIPVWWGKNQKGMQAQQELEEPALSEAKAKWLEGGKNALALSRALGALGLHKGLSNRVTEPWAFITMVVTATEYENFFALRGHPDAQHELQKNAYEAIKLYKESKPQELKAGTWHLPFVSGYDFEELLGAGFSIDDICKVSVGRCSRISYLTHESKRDPRDDVKKAEDLAKDGHMSPYEHVAQAMTHDEWTAWASDQAQEWIKNRVPVGNLWGWRQLRKTLKSEHNFGQIRNDG
jgi:hypothetical protein